MHSSSHKLGAQTKNNWGGGAANFTLSAVTTTAKKQT